MLTVKKKEPEKNLCKIPLKFVLLNEKEHSSKNFYHLIYSNSMYQINFSVFFFNKYVDASRIRGTVLGAVESTYKYETVQCRGGP